MSKLKSISVVGVCCLIVTVILLFQQQGSARPDVIEKDAYLSSISVSGSADVLIVPDEVVITLGIDTRDKDIVKAKTENDKMVEKIINIARKYKVESKYIQTDYMDIRPGDISKKPYYDYYEPVKQDNMGYIVRKKITVTVKDLSKFEEFLTEVVKNGAEYVQGVEFKTTELRKHKDRARELAIKAAREKADAMADALGQKAGKAISITEEQEHYWSWYDSWYSSWYPKSINTFSNVQNVISFEGQGQDVGEIEPGHIKVSAKISVDFLLD
ncbi:UNVERIFIED_CONTAM: uncharacterized protein YggE [Acetivibrio alkalicellulosi]